MRGIQELAATPLAHIGPEEPADRLIGHLMVATRWGLIDAGCEAGMLGDFFGVASVTQRAFAISTVGLHLMEEPTLSDDERRRLTRLWECRLAVVQRSTDSEAGTELSGFGWWFASGALDPDWSLHQLMEAMQISGPIAGERDVVSRLETLYEERPVVVLGALERLIELGSSEWFVYGARDLITPLLERGLVGSGDSSRIARDLVNRLVARGHGDFGRLISP